MLDGAPALSFLLVFLGAGLGGAGRHGVNVAAFRLLGPNAFPYGTLAINVAGSFLMGVVVGLFAARSAGGGQDLRLFLTTGVLGGFTTFSAFSLDAISLWQRGEPAAAAAYVGASVLASLAALALALLLVRAAT